VGVAVQSPDLVVVGDAATRNGNDCMRHLWRRVDGYTCMHAFDDDDSLRCWLSLLWCCLLLLCFVCCSG